MFIPRPLSCGSLLGHVVQAVRFSHGKKTVNLVFVPISVHDLSPESPGAQEVSSPAPRKDTGLCSTVNLGSYHLRVPLSLQLDLSLC